MKTIVVLLIGVYTFVKKKITNGRKAESICPLIDNNG
jgi:hypothetical protein